MTIITLIYKLKDECMSNGTFPKQITVNKEAYKEIKKYLKRGSKYSGLAKLLYSALYGIKVVKGY